MSADAQHQLVDRISTCGMTVAMPSTKAAGSRVSSRTSPEAMLVIFTRKKRARRSAVLASCPPASPSREEDYTSFQLSRAD